MKKKKNSNRSYRQKALQFATYANMTDRHAKIKHQAKMSKLFMTAMTNGAADTLMNDDIIDVDVVEENNGQTEGE